VNRARPAAVEGTTARTGKGKEEEVESTPCDFSL